jgi:hypothetical protein
VPIAASQPVPFRSNDCLLYGIILGVITFWLFAQTTLNPDFPDGFEFSSALRPNLSYLSAC